MITHPEHAQADSDREWGPSARWPAYRDALGALLEDNPIPGAIDHPRRPTLVVLGADDPRRRPKTCSGILTIACGSRYGPLTIRFPVRFAERLAERLAELLDEELAASPRRPAAPSAPPLPRR